MGAWSVAVRRVSFEVLAARSSNLGSVPDRHVLVKSYHLCGAMHFPERGSSP